MSEHDHRVLFLADLSVTEAGKLLGRRRQTIHRGISNERQYFRLPDLIAILRYAEAKDNQHYAALQKHILNYYAVPHWETKPSYRLLFPGEYKLNQLRAVAKASEQIIFVLTDNTGAFGPRTALTILLNELIQLRPDDVDVVMSCNHSRQMYAERFTFPRPPRALVGPALLAPVVLFRNAAGERAFVPGRLEICELSLSDTSTVWQLCRSAGVRETWRRLRPKRMKK
jgi:hypothetical protein